MKYLKKISPFIALVGILMVDSCAIPESGEQASANYSFEKVEFI
jgi:hypothetical protein